MIRAILTRFTKPRRDLLAERDALMHEARKLRWQHKSTKDVQAKLRALTNECLGRKC